MVQPGMRITVNAAMRARDVSHPRPDGEEPTPTAPAQAKPAEPAKRTKAAKNERRRQGKRGTTPRNPPQNGL